MSNMNIPGMHISDVHIPDIHMPDMQMPDMQMPDMRIPGMMHRPEMHDPDSDGFSGRSFFASERVCSKLSTVSSANSIATLAECASSCDMTENECLLEGPRCVCKATSAFPSQSGALRGSASSSSRSSISGGSGSSNPVGSSAVVRDVQVNGRGVGPQLSITNVDGGLGYSSDRFGYDRHSRGFKRHEYHEHHTVSIVLGAVGAFAGLALVAANLIMRRRAGAAGDISDSNNNSDSHRGLRFQEQGDVFAVPMPTAVVLGAAPKSTPQVAVACM
jgi:hypothetical protein